ncbi:hypothetical protein KO465_06050 [Candidatus Micrarchaeota archaeon]|nr:hypothetical protein [Candidatus Micrarchaeota archaeon]
MATPNLINKALTDNKKLIQTSRGIYEFEDRAIIPTKRIPLVVVHPYFVFETPSKDKIEEDNQDWAGEVRNIEYYTTYRKKLENLIADPGRAVLTFEFGKTLETTAERYREIGKKDNTYFMEWGGTFLSPGIDDGNSWIGTFIFLMNLYYKTEGVGDVVEIDVSGGFLFKQRDRFLNREYYGGCLGGMIEKLNEYKIKTNIIEYAIF